MVAKNHIGGLVTANLLNHSYLVVDSTDSGILMEIAEYFTFWVPNYKFMPAYKSGMFDGKIRLYNLRTKQIYAGLYYHLERFCKERGYSLKVLNHKDYGDRTRIGSAEHQTTDSDLLIKFLSNLSLSSRGEKITLKDYQISAIIYCMTNLRATLLSPTASGKSAIIYCIIRYFLHLYPDYKLLIVVPTTSLVEQMVSDFADYSHFDPSFDASKMCHKIYSGKEKNSDAQIQVSTWQSIYNFHGPWFEKFSGVINDECHLAKAKSLTSIMTKSKEAFLRIGTTGTLDGSNTNELTLNGIFGPTKRFVSTKKLMDDGDLAQLKIQCLLLNHSDDNKKLVSKLKYQEEVKFLVGYSPRNKFIRNLAVSQTGNTLVLFQYVDTHGVPLYNDIKSHLKDSKRNVHFVSGKVDTDSREEIRKICDHDDKDGSWIIVASMGCFSTGINIRNIHSIIFASPTKSQIKVLQSIGRSLRISDNGQDALLLDIIDDFSWKSKSNFTLEHGKERVKIYNKEQFNYKINKVNML